MATVVAGSYERFVFGYKLDNLPGGGGGGGDGAPSVVRSFTLDAHLTQCKSVAARGGFIASGGADDLIRVWHHNPDGGTADLGTLAGHEGSVSCLAFHGPSSASEPTRLVSGGVDGNLIIWSVGQWDSLKTLKAHRGGVTALSLHHSGLVAMTAGADSHIAMWDMKKGRVAHKTKQRVKPDILQFTPSGGAFATVSGSRLTLTSAETGAVTGVFDAPKRAMCLAMAGADTLALLGCEGGDVVGYDVRAPPVRPAVTITKAHPARVKALEVPVVDHDAGAVMGGPAGGPAHLVSASSEGAVRLWDLRTVGQGGAATARGLGVDAARDQPLAEAMGGGRFTCMATMPSALPSKIAAAVLAESGRDRGEDAARKKARKEEKRRRAERAREAAAAEADVMDAPPTKRKAKAAAASAKASAKAKTRDDGWEKPWYEDAGFEIVAEDEEGEEEAPAPSRATTGKKKKARADGDAKRRRDSEREPSRSGADEVLVKRKPGFKTGKKGGGEREGGRSYEEVATAARRKGSGVKKATPSRGFAKPSRG